MRIEVLRDDFARLLTTNGKVVNSKNTLPILAHILLDANETGLRVRSTDLDIDIGNEIDAKGEPGSCCVDYKLLNDIVRRASTETVTLELTDDQLVVKSGRSRFKLKTLPAGDFPTMGEPDYDAEFEVDLAALVAPVAFAQSTETVRYYLNGVLLHVIGNDLVAVATDGHRLARNAIEHECASDLAGMQGIIIPSKTIAILPKGTIKLAVSDTKIRITQGRTVMLSKLIDGTYPDYQRVIPQGNDKVVGFDRDVMMKASDRVSVVSSERGRAVKLSISDEEASLSVRGEGEAADIVPVNYAGDPVQIGFQSKYLAEILSVMPGGDINLLLADSGSPAILKSDAAPQWLGVLMPMRVA